MNGKDFNAVVSLILREDTRYDRGAYFFLREALDYTVKKQAKAPRAGRTRHVDGPTLCEGIREFALQQYGPMAATLLAEWGLKETADFGEIVYNLVDYNVFGVQETDRKEDFAGVYDFDTAFAAPFRPRQQHAMARRHSTAPFNVL
jgi:uncharacterized repeat protein (TIGR04138 family)